MIIYYNPRLDILGVLDANGWLRIENHFHLYMALTDEWEAVSYV